MHDVENCSTLKKKKINQQFVRNKMQPKYKEKEIDACHDDFPEIR